MGPWDRDGGFYILRPHTAAFSKQSTIIRSDKRANTEHSRVKIKPPPALLLLLPPSLSSPSSSRILTLLRLLPRFRTSLSPPALVFRTPAASRGEESRLTLGSTRVFQLFPERGRWMRAVYYLLMKRLKKRGYFIRSHGTRITHLRCVSSGFFSDFSED